MGAENPMHDESISAVTGPNGKPITPEELGMEEPSSTPGVEYPEASTPGVEEGPTYTEVVQGEIDDAKGKLDLAITELAQEKLNRGEISLARRIIAKEMEYYDKRNGL